jgi:hypothetical protein
METQHEVAAGSDVEVIGVAGGAALVERGRGVARKKLTVGRHGWPTAVRLWW